MKNIHDRMNLHAQEQTRFSPEERHASLTVGTARGIHGEHSVETETPEWDDAKWRADHCCPDPEETVLPYDQIVNSREIVPVAPNPFRKWPAKLDAEAYEHADPLDDLGEDSADETPCPPGLMCDECGDTDLRLSHEPGEEGWWRCLCGCLHRPAGGCSTELARENGFFGSGEAEQTEHERRYREWD